MLASLAMQKPLQLKTVVARPVRACGLRPTFAQRSQQQPRLQSLFAGECYCGNRPASSIHGKRLQSLLNLPELRQDAYWIVLPAQVDKQSLLFQSQALELEAGQSPELQAYTLPLN